MAIHPGESLAGYRVEHLLGRGGMGEVWSARSFDGTRVVAIKVLLPKAAVNPELVARFEREARAAAAIDSPYVCRLLGIERDRSGAHLLVFEQLEGETLSDRLKRELYLAFAEVGPLVDDVLQGLAAAHAAGVVHRDLKPGNIFVERLRVPAPDGRHERAKVLDFGISKLSKKSKDGRRDEPSLTDFDATLGSFSYMAPEQVRGAARADGRADIYAVGTVVFRSLAGRLPFEGPNAGTILALKMDRPAPSLSEVTGEQWPAGLERFMACALQRDRELRFATALDALAAWRSIQPEAIARRAGARAFRPAPEDERSAAGYGVDASTEVDAPVWDGASTDVDGPDEGTKP
ncbi:MAG: serine/threonine protein kinase [Myxococcales bacterium]|nr:serine/threonine protein kinase [Myxococcales bacterium]